MLFQRKAPVSWLVVGLGNPGGQYDNTRHNAGFMVADELARRGGFSIQRVKFKALTAAVPIGGQGALVMKPTTYMNLSGEAVGEAARFYKLSHDRVLVVSDDVDLPLGKLRLRTSGSAGGHNGLKSIIQHLGSDRFPRLKVGVGGKPHPDYDLADWVLGKLQGEDKKLMDETVKRAADAVECLLKEGLEKAMNQFN